MILKVWCSPAERPLEIFPSDIGLKLKYFQVWGVARSLSLVVIVYDLVHACMRAALDRNWRDSDRPQMLQSAPALEQLIRPLHAVTKLFIAFIICGK
jgi:hypothetical protein